MINSTSPDQGDNPEERATYFNKTSKNSNTHATASASVPLHRIDESRFMYTHVSKSLCTCYV